MKQVILTETETFKAKDILLGVLRNAPVGQGFTIGQMERRLKLIDAIEAGDGSFVLEDEDYNHLKDCVEGFNGFLGGPMMRDLVRMRNEIRDAKAPAKPELKAV